MTPSDDVRSAGDPYDLSRFVRAQEGDYERALAELQSGQKRTHWMWYIFPQLDGLAFSATSKRYAVKSAEEATCVPGASHPGAETPAVRGGGAPHRGALRHGDLRVARRPETAVMCDTVRVRLPARLGVRPPARQVLSRRA